MLKSRSLVAKDDFNGAATTERGRRTRHALMNAALDLMGSGRSFNSLSIREVTKQVGVVPATFYRHFKDMDELSSAVVRDCGESLRAQLRLLRKSGSSTNVTIRESFVVFKQYVEEQPSIFLLVSGERHGGSPVMRELIRTEINRFVDELAQDLYKLKIMPNLTLPALRNICDLAINTALSAAGELMDVSRTDKLKQRQLVDAYVQQLSVIFWGASTWRENPHK